MDQQLKQKWVEALRSGEYKQTRGRLRTKAGTRHCCLGVLCEIVSSDIDWEVESTWLPVSQLNEAGVESHFALRLARMNDSGLPFTKIADYIEANL